MQPSQSRATRAADSDEVRCLLTDWDRCTLGVHSAPNVKKQSGQVVRVAMIQLLYESFVSRSVECIWCVRQYTFWLLLAYLQNPHRNTPRSNRTRSKAWRGTRATSCLTKTLRRSQHHMCRTTCKGGRGRGGRGGTKRKVAWQLSFGQETQCMCCMQYVDVRCFFKFGGASNRSPMASFQTHTQILVRTKAGRRASGPCTRRCQLCHCP